MPKSTFIDFRAVKREVTMVQVLEHYGLMSRMKQNGDSITGACPIHEGKNETAFRVSISKNCWNCFSQCGCGGNVLDFVAKKEKVSLPKAARLLVEWFNLKIESPKNDPPRREKSDSRVRDKNESKREAAKPVEAEDEKGENKPLEFVLKNLQPEHPYLTERGLSPETIQTFGLGFCQKGLLTGRIAIPIHNAKGELVAYAGRWPGDTDKEKYLFPKGFKKSLELFNLDRAGKEPAEKPLVIVEGFFDCMMLHQHGCRKVIALIHSFFHYVALQEPALGALAQRVLAIKSKRHIKKPIDFLTRTEAEALLSAPDQQTWSGRRDRALLLLALQTGLRLSEIISLCCQDIALDTGAHVRCTGKGRKIRCIPLRKETVATLRAWLRERNAQPLDPLFPNVRGKPLSRDGVQYLLTKHVATARQQCPSLKNKRVSPHVLRHSTAMDLLQCGVDRSVIALWLGHERMDTTQIYLHASLELKEKALAKTEPFYGRPRRYHPPEQLMAFLQSL